MDLNFLLKFTVENSASDLHINIGCKPKIRKNGKLITILESDLIDKNISKSLCYSILNSKEIEKFEIEKELDFAISIDNIGRFRVNYFYSLGAVIGIFRNIPTKILSLDELKTPTIFKELIKKEKGLILITGSTGSGKSTTLSALINEINETENKHILTIEDPVEFIHKHKKSTISQRDVGKDTLSFKNALKSALREDPDIILIGEMRDKETISLAITAAETGHLVFATLHTNSASTTINRIVDSFSSEEQQQIRTQLSLSLISVISQTLIPKITNGRIAVFEIMVNNSGISNLIRENKIPQIYSQIQMGKIQYSMETQTQNLIELLHKNIISKENALKYANNVTELTKFIR